MAAAVLLMAAGCSGGDEGSGGGSAKPPAGGWPQPENGQITAKMCGLLTEADYAEFGHKLLLDLEASTASKATSNGIYCSAPPADQLTLSLQPTAEAAEIYYQGVLASRKFQVVSDKRDTILVENLVTGADSSWLDYWVDSGEDDATKDYELVVRRGSLMLSLVLSGVDEAKEKDPKGTLVALADRVLQRVGELGKTDTGVTRMLHLEVNGKGKARQIQYSVPDRPVKTLENVKLPWKADLPLADHGDNLQNLSLNAHTPISRGLPVQIACRIQVDDKIVSEEGDFGFAGCLSHVPKP
ncbi:hypothetical protein AB0M20_17855 [Actinoplanes sp. NPDC051633]|uniref:hypothetical protein n=1 Tax=Actinoplanes sp. NPDC051633 TaxID=3155670 RepID=UPI00342858B5